MELAIVRDMDKCYLILEDEQEANSGYQQKMILHNKIDGLLDIEIRHIDGGSRYYYDITDRVSIKDYFLKNKVSSSKVKFIFERLIQVIQGAKEYMLEQDNFILQAQYIFTNMEGNQLFLCFYEKYHIGVREQLIKLTEFFMELIDYKEERAVTMTYGIYKVLREENCNFTNIKDVIGQCIQKATVQQSREQDEKKEIMYYPVQKTGVVEKKGIQTVLCGTINLTTLIVILKGRWLFYENTKILNIKNCFIGILLLVVVNAVFLYVYGLVKEGRNRFSLNTQFYENEDTIVLENSNEFALREERGNGQLTILEFPFVIGASKNQARGVLQFPGVSKRHAVIDKQNGECSIMDLGSTNGTFLNGIKLDAMVKEELKENDKITIANITYQFIKL